MLTYLKHLPRAVGKGSHCWIPTKRCSYLLAEHIYYHGLDVHSAMKTGEKIKCEPSPTIKWREPHSRREGTTHHPARDTSSLHTGLPFCVLNAAQPHAPPGHQRYQFSAERTQSSKTKLRSCTNPVGDTRRPTPNSHRSTTLPPATWGHQHRGGSYAAAGWLPLAPGLLPHCQMSKGLLAAATSVRQELSEGKAVVGCARWQ